MRFPKALRGERARHVREVRSKNLYRALEGRSPAEHEEDRCIWQRMASHGLVKGRGPI